MNRIISTLALVLMLGLTSCAQLSQRQQTELGVIEAYDLDPQTPKSPVLAGVLNVGPGFGDAYNGQWGGFVVNLLLWPISVAWGIPEAAITAGNINDQATVAYYMHGAGQKELRDAKNGVRPTPPAENMVP
jgi:hypothetical protein